MCAMAGSQQNNQKKPHTYYKPQWQRPPTDAWSLATPQEGQIEDAEPYHLNSPEGDK